MPSTQRYTDEQLLDELRRISDVVSGPVTIDEFEAHTDISAATVRRRFGSWRLGLIAAGLKKRSARRVSLKRRRRARYSDAQLIEELRAVSERVGSKTITQTDVQDHSETIGAKILASHFGSFAAALSAAGLQSSKTANRWTDEDLAANFHRVAGRVGRIPRLSDLDRPPSQVSSRTYTFRYGPWEAVIDHYRRAGSKQVPTRSADERGAAELPALERMNAGDHTHDCRQDNSADPETDR